MRRKRKGREKKGKIGEGREIGRGNMLDMFRDAAKKILFSVAWPGLYRIPGLICRISGWPDNQIPSKIIGRISGKISIHPVQP